MPDLHALILDYGDVLSRPQRDRCVQAMADRLGVLVSAFRAAYRQHRRPYDAGLPAADYWQRVLDTLGRGTPAMDTAATIEWLIGTDVDSWTDYREETWALARAFRAGGRLTAFLSNGIPEVMARLRAERALGSCFDVIVVSSEVGLTKPDPRIYELCLARLGVDAARALFVDDRIENVEAAAAVGLRTLHFTGDESVGVLRELL
jgi:putative hydrolase of the HAD superfamily